MNFYDVISEININAENRMITVCEGDHAGERMILSSGVPIWRSDDDGLLVMHEEEAKYLPDGRLGEIAGEKVFSEILGNEKHIVICGCGHVSMPVIRIARMMGCRVTAIDDREQFIGNALDNGADEGLCMGFEEALDKIPGSPDTFFIIVTRGHRYDSECLLKIVKKPYAYIGMIGSRRKVSMVKQTLMDAGIDQETIDSVHTPIGLPIGAETPEEIAVAIMAEIIEVKNRQNRGYGFPADVMKALLSDDREPAVLATIVSKKGSSPRGAGTRMLVNADGSIVATVGGGSAEARTIERSLEMIEAYKEAGRNEIPKPVIMKVDMTGKTIEDEGMICGGAVGILLELV